MLTHNTCQLFSLQVDSNVQNGNDCLNRQKHENTNQTLEPGDTPNWEMDFKLVHVEER